ncbi:MAG TPA: DNA polymerase I [Candidatus Binatia bacterium]|nr:DNA polymerase I [Candidatus Binatia bacterium]
MPDDQGPLTPTLDLEGPAAPARPTLLLIDGHALVYRAFFAMPALTNSRGELTNAAYGFTSMLLKAFTDQHPTYAIAAFDPPGPTFRHQEMAGYKAQRPEMPVDLRPQVQWAREIVAALGIPEVEIPGYEADDVIGSLSVKAVEAGLDVVVVTGDIDTLQLVNPHVRVFINRRGITETIVYDLDKVRERYGFEPPLVADFKALQGDVSDNIPGVPGIGEKTAMSLIQQHGPLEAILEALPRMRPGRVQSTLTEHTGQARLSKRMATIQMDLAVPLDLEQARVGGYEDEAVRALFDRLEFRSLLPRLAEAFSHGAAPRPGAPGQGELSFGPPPAAASQVEVVEGEAQIDELIQSARAARRFALRSVPTGPARTSEVLGVAITPLGSTRSWWLSLAVHRHAVESLLGDPELVIDGYDLKREVLAWGPRLRARLGFDAMLAAYIDNPRTRVPSLTVLAHDLGLLRLDAEEDLLGTGRQRRNLGDVPAAELAEYYGRWVGLVEPVRDALTRQLTTTGLLALHDELELPLVPILAEMERVGILVDCDELAAISAEMRARVRAAESEVQDLVGHAFNLGSTQQLATVLYDELGLAAGRKTKFGRSTDADTLEALREEHPIVGLVLEWRQLTKLQGTYVDALPLLCDRDGRIHTSFHQAVAATGRLSSADPNLQNVPIRTEWGQRIRHAFIADSGWRLVSADYSQVELRVLAHATGEERLIEAFARGEDIHRRTAAQVYGVDPAAVTPDMRRVAKVVNFGVVYGLSDFGLARDTGMSREEAAAWIHAYFENFPSVTRWLEQTRMHAREWGWVETFTGRRRHLPDIRAANRQLRLAAERMAVNMPIQGGAAEIMKKAMIDTDRALRESGSAGRVLLQVHDELVLEVPPGELEALIPLVRRAMSGAQSLVVPLVVDVKVGQNWQEMTPVPAVP